MYANMFPECCGGTLAYAFCDTVRETRDALRAVTARGVNVASSQAGFVIATLNSDQWKRYSRVFLSEGFRVVSKTRNPNSGNVVRVLIYDVSPVK